ncbi:MAG: hypothetical protein J2P25_06800 [Nocardiopsaceae bacterium]|nr:hypothetical protein [Nocardiopsaceae bacterium]
MNDTDPYGQPEAVRPAAPEMVTPRPEMFSPLTRDENDVLRAHLRSGWAKQAVVYPALDEVWKETSRLLRDVGAAWDTAWQVRHPGPEAEAEATP